MREARGTIVESAPLAGLDEGLRSQIGAARRAVYRSVSGFDGAATEVSGTFFLPSGKPPAGGWPVISFAHGTTGLTNDCGPSESPDLMGYASSVISLVTSGHAVAFTDYQGLGHPGRHAYLEPRSAAFDIIDAVRALRNLYPGIVSDKWLALGGSQGGQASWAANEYAGDYGDGLDLVGTIAFAPAADLSGLADGARNGTLTPDQVGLMPSVIAGLEVAQPDFVVSDYLRGPAAEHLGKLISCDEDKEQYFAQLRPEQVRPASAAAADRLTEILDTNALPQRPLAAPLYVANGSQDTLILPEWVSAAVSRACSRGGTVEHKEMAGRGHVDPDPGAEAYLWMQDRFAGKAAPSNCFSDR
ncbi:lipase [Mycobacterium sp. CPCC 205372]|uniref:Lipase n=1 Tax=Mycobacterium hippophais TaxID=3016340 RepID=A0ABT4PRV8_9MYCO|nr:lipase family protein [Mycobacterium hippophais]MCZ8379280.1 lipase [Mycobacterium hippophais]